jgi:hypothetical protein
MRPFAFIVGRGRSGTTLVRAQLDSHPEMAVVHETQFLVGLARSRRRYETPEGFATERFLTELSRDPSFFRLDMSREDVAEALSVGGGTASVADALRAIYGTYASRRGKKRYGDKTPGHVMHITMLASLLPEARFLHVIRDGRDSTLSYLDASFGPTSVAEAAVYWRRFVTNGRRAGRAIGTRRYREVRYESLVAEPEAELRKICSFLDLPYDDAMLRYPERAAELVGKIHHNLVRPPTQGMRDWRRDMSRDDVVLFESLAGGLLTELGYERAVPKIPATERLRAWRARLQVNGGRLARRARGSSRAVGAASGREANP